MKKYELTIPAHLYETRAKRVYSGGSYRLTKNLRIGGGAPITWNEWTHIATGELKFERVGETLENGNLNLYFVGEENRKMLSNKIIDVTMNIDECSLIIAVENRQKSMLYQLPVNDNNKSIMPELYELITGEHIEIPEPEPEVEEEPKEHFSRLSGALKKFNKAFWG